MFKRATFMFALLVISFTSHGAHVEAPAVLGATVAHKEAL